MDSEKSKKIKELFNAVMELNGLIEQNPKPCVFFEVAPHVAWISINYYLDGWKEGEGFDRQKIIRYDNDDCIHLIKQEIFFIKELKRRKNAH